MKKKYYLLIIWIVIFNVFSPFFLFVNAVEQPALCSWPSKMMSLYFQFQREMIGALSNSSATGKWLRIWDSKWWLFEWKVLQLPTALNLATYGMLWRGASTISSGISTLVLALLVSSSTITSNTEGLAILFRDRPIVRDYKELMDIETEIFDVVFFRSKTINLVRQMEWNLPKDLKDIIIKYQDLGLLWKWWNGELSSSIGSCLSVLIAMNAAMKHFMLFWWSKSLENYTWCLWNNGSSKCSSNIAVLTFSQEAINQLKQDYKWFRLFWPCNSRGNFLKDMRKGVKNSGESNFRAAFEDIKDAHNRLKEVLLDRWRWSIGKSCDISDYEMAQLKAYWWSDRECWDGVTLAPMMKAVRDFSDTKKATVKGFNDVTTWIWNTAKDVWENTSDSMGEFFNDLWNIHDTMKQRQKWREKYWDGMYYNPEFSFEGYAEYSDVYESVMYDFSISQLNASSSELWIELVKIKWLVDQVDKATDAIWGDNGKKLRKKLRDIVNYQCSS